MLNSWTFSGRVGADPELRKSQSGESVLSFRVANDVGFGENKHTNWVDCSYWGTRAEKVAAFIKKGDKIGVNGQLKLEEFTRRDGTPGSKLAVRVNDLDLASRQEGSDASRSQSASSGSRSRPSGYDGDRPLPPPGNRDGGNRSGSGGGTSRGGGKPAFDQDLDDEIPF